MKSKFTKLFSLAILIHFSLQAQINPSAMVAKMGRGINLGNVLSAPVEGNWAPPVKESYFDDISLVGFKTVRIPIRFDTYTTPLSSVTYTAANGSYIGNVSNYTVSDSYLNRVEQVVDWALSKGLVAIIDVHGDKWYWESYDPTSTYYKTGNDLKATEDRFKAVWTAISNRFQNKSENLLFEIMNEAYFSMNEAQVDNANTNILNIIRVTNPTRNVIVNGGKKNSYESPLQMGTSYLNNNNYLYNDNYLIATFHYYLPRAFTASADATNNDNDWGTTADKLSVDTHFGIVKSWSQTVGVPVFLGEFGADNEGGYNYKTGAYGLNGGPDAVSREAYHRFVANLAISNGFSFAVWDAGDESNKTIYKVTNKDWVVNVRNAVLNAQCTTSGIIDNADVECNYDYVWELTTQNGAAATRNNAVVAQSYNSSKTIKVNVSTVGANYESVLLKNKTATTGFLVGEYYSYKCFAKGSNSQTFNIRIKALINGVTVYQTSPALSLTNVYQEFAFQYNVQANTTSLEFQVLCGLNTGDYYFDNFSQIIAPPNITSSQTALTGFAATTSSPSASQMVNVGGTNLSNSIVVTASSNYEVSTDNTTFFSLQTIVPTAGTLVSKPIYVRLKTGLTAETHNGTILITSVGANVSRVITCSGSTTIPLGVNQESIITNTTTIYKSKGILYINSGTTPMENIKIFDIQGRLIREHKNVKAMTFALKELIEVHQVLIIKIATEDGKFVSKKVIN